MVFDTAANKSCHRHTYHHFHPYQQYHQNRLSVPHIGEKKGYGHVRERFFELMHYYEITTEQIFIIIIIIDINTKQ